MGFRKTGLMYSSNFLIHMQSSGAATVTCNGNYINPLMLEGDNNDDENRERGDPTVSMGSGRRKKRSTVKRTLTKRQDASPAEQEFSENRNLVSAVVLTASQLASHPMLTHLWIMLSIFNNFTDGGSLHNLPLGFSYL